MTLYPFLSLKVRRWKNVVSYKLNLARRPFRNRGLPWSVALLLATISLAVFAFVLMQNAQVRRDNERIKRDVEAVNKEVAKIKEQDQQIAQSLTPQQKRDWHSANDLINRKRFPWSRLFVDLEGVLPGSVRVNRISVRDISVVNGEMISEFELAVQSKDPDVVVENMLHTMENSGVFQADLVNQALLKGKDEIGSEFTLRVRYRPRAGVTQSAPTVAQLGGRP